jgi:hypothetical protein
MPPFNKDFDQDFDKQLIDVYKQQAGCFACRKPDASLKCARCQIAFYCNRDCQVQDWKGQHKQLCNTWCDNRAEEDGCKGPVPICMRSCGFIGENSMVQAMQVRRDLFFKEVKRAAAPTGLRLSLTASVIGMFGKIRLVAIVHLVDEDFQQINVSHVLVDTVDEASNAAVNALYQGSGTISDATREKVLEGLCVLATQAKEHGGLVVSMTFGRGLMFLTDCKPFQERVNEAAGFKIMWVPDKQYVV